MKTIRAKDLTKNNILVEDFNKTRVFEVRESRRGSIIAWVDEGIRMKFFKPLDVLVIE